MNNLNFILILKATNDYKSMIPLKLKLLKYRYILFRNTLKWDKMIEKAKQENNKHKTWDGDYVR